MVSIRKVQFYLEEVKSLLTSNEEFARQTNAETVAMVLLVKHFSGRSTRPCKRRPAH